MEFIAAGLHTFKGRDSFVESDPLTVVLPSHRSSCSQLSDSWTLALGAILVCVHTNRVESSPIQPSQTHKDAAVTL